MDLDRLQDPTGFEPVTYGLEVRRPCTSKPLNNRIIFILIQLKQYSK